MRSYRERMAGYATMRAIDVYYARVDATGILAYADKGARAMLEGTVKSTAHHDAVQNCPSSPRWSTASAGSSSIPRP